jgi:hypothetical protein
MHVSILFLYSKLFLLMFNVMLSYFNLFLMDVIVLYCYLSFHFKRSQTSVYLASRKGVGGNPGTIFFRLRQKGGGGRAGKGEKGWPGYGSGAASPVSVCRVRDGMDS